ncbi:snare-like protein, partial [Wilcoxina mikolae CBS 423.85]
WMEIDSTLTHRRYASLHVIAASCTTDNHLLTLEILHRFVQSLDMYFGDVCELDIVFGIREAYAVLDELVVAGELCESSK